MTAILLKFAPWIAGVVVLLGLGGWAGYKVNPWEGRYTALQATDAKARAEGEAAVAKTLQAQLAQAQTVSANNAQTVEKLSAENAQIVADHSATLDRVRRLEQLLVLASRPTSTSAGVSQASGGPSVAGASDPPGITSIEGLLVAAATECEQTANQLNALIEELRPQL
jgi:hypothetical protein